MIKVKGEESNSGKILFQKGLLKEISAIMMNITAAEVNRLRQTTGAGMMDCKNALTESGGDFEKAIDILREKGKKVAINRSDRHAKEGAVIALVSTDSKKGIISLLN